MLDLGLWVFWVWAWGLRFVVQSEGLRVYSWWLRFETLGLAPGVYSVDLSKPQKGSPPRLLDI